MKKSIDGIHAEPDYEQVIFDHLRWLATEQGKIVDPKRRDNGEGYQALACASNNLSDLRRKARIAKQAVNYRAVVRDFVKDTDERLKSIQDEVAGWTEKMRREGEAVMLAPIESRKELIERLIVKHTPQAEPFVPQAKPKDTPEGK